MKFNDFSKARSKIFMCEIRGRMDQLLMCLFSLQLTIEGTLIAKNCQLAHWRMCNHTAPVALQTPKDFVFCIMYSAWKRCAKHIASYLLRSKNMFTLTPLSIIPWTPGHTVLLALLIWNDFRRVLTSAVKTVSKPIFVQVSRHQPPLTLFPLCTNVLTKY